ncbi:MAG: RecQ family ATP-dependent DNA helicase, partial [Synergistaceae bacterium]|nr:RecQ family ATP-dependent DNA helicase [Synergistaceae bacterium]
QAASINSSMAWDEVVSIFRLVRSGKIKLLYIAPERLENNGFLEFFHSLDIAMVIVDEAHCVSQWGHDFRPSYLNIAPAIASLGKRAVVAAFTATATPEVRDDIIRQLELKSPFSITTGFDRENLFFQVEHPGDKTKYLLDYVKKFPNVSGIVYCSTRKEVESVRDKICRSGISAVRYHAGLDSDERLRSQEAFIYDKVGIIVATNAFGMGIDKSNVRYVIHYNMPATMDAYYQEAGRAGRDGLPADCIMLFGEKDIMTARYFISQSEDNGTKKAAYLKLRGMVDYCHTTGCLRSCILNYFGEEDAPETCSSCGSCTSQADLVDITTEAKKIISSVYRMAEHTGGRKFGSAILTDVLRGSQKAQIISLGFNKISTWGIMKGYKVQAIREMINFLAAEGFLQVEDGEFPVLSFTDRTTHFLKSDTTLLMRKHEERAEKPLTTQKRKQTEIVNEELFDLLRSLRKEFSTAEGVPPYVVFSDKTLSAMCEMLPSDREDFLEVPGVGNVKLEKYGDAFIDVINRWRSNA